MLFIPSSRQDHVLESVEGCQHMSAQSWGAGVAQDEPRTRLR